MDIIVDFYTGQVIFDEVDAFVPNADGYLVIERDNDQHYIPVESFEYFTVIDYDMDD